MRRQVSAAPTKPIELAIPIACLIDLAIDKVWPDAGASSSQYLENQSGSGRNGPRYAGGNIGLSRRRGVTPGSDLGIFSSDPLGWERSFQKRLAQL
jgi:hypothetical protein